MWFGIEKLKNLLAQVALNKGIHRSVRVQDTITDQRGQLTVKLLSRVSPSRENVRAFCQGIMSVAFAPVVALGWCLDKSADW